VSKESSVLVHAAAGGTGQLITQICRIKGAKNIIGTVGSEEKATLAKNFGATHTIVYSKAGVVVSDEVRKIVPSGVNVVYDGVGASTWEQSMKSVGRRGDVVFFGNASGPVPPVDPLLLTKYGSIRMTRPSLVDFTVTEEETDRRAQDLFRWVASGELKVNIHKSFNLQDVKLAHQEIEFRAAASKIVLIKPEKINSRFFLSPFLQRPWHGLQETMITKRKGHIISIQSRKSKKRLSVQSEEILVLFLSTWKIDSECSLAQNGCHQFSVRSKTNNKLFFSLFINRFPSQTARVLWENFWIQQIIHGVY